MVRSLVGPLFFGNIEVLGQYHVQHVDVDLCSVDDPLGGGSNGLVINLRSLQWKEIIMSLGIPISGKILDRQVYAFTAMPGSGHRSARERAAATSSASSNCAAGISGRI